MKNNVRFIFQIKCRSLVTKAIKMEDPYSCSSCLKTFENIDDFSEHLGSHIEEEAIKTSEPSNVSNTNVKSPSKVLFPSGHDAGNSNMTFGDIGSNLVL